MSEAQVKKHPHSSHIIYLAMIGTVFLAFTLLFLFFPRSTYSELEKRDLLEFPEIEAYGNDITKYPAAVSSWFSDSEPYRDFFMGMSMSMRHLLSYNPGNDEDNISYKPAETPHEPDGETIAEGALESEGYENPLADANAKASNSGTIVVGSGPEVRALMAFGGSSAAGDKFVRTASAYHEEFPGINIYALVAPLATEFYLPEKGKSLSSPQKPVLDHIRENLPPSVKFVDTYSALSHHVNEDIFLRTDHHWAPLGAYYAAKEFAGIAGVPFKGLDSYNKNVIHNFVGSMYGYTRDIAVKNAPEDFIYYTPRNLDYKALFTTFNTDKSYRVVSATKPYEAEFFRKFKDGSGNAYLTFMGSDQNLVKVTTGTPSKRKLLIIKDSYGNALPGYLFYSFGEVHVVDFRYFPRNLKEYVKENGITDILLAFNIFNACSSSNMNRVKALIDNSQGIEKSSGSAEAPHKDSYQPQAAPAPIIKEEPAEESSEPAQAIKEEPPLESAE